MDLIKKYFPDLKTTQYERFEAMFPLYSKWNNRINVISRKDMHYFFIRHVLHSLSIAKVISFQPEARILDAGTGGGFPGIPLAVLFPQTDFILVDSIGKKIRVVEEVVAELGLKNVNAYQLRVETLKDKYDFVVSRAVTALPVFFQWVNRLIKPGDNHTLVNGILYLKGGNFAAELDKIHWPAQVFELSQWFDEAFFETKKLIHLAKL